MQAQITALSSLSPDKDRTLVQLHLSRQQTLVRVVNVMKKLNVYLTLQIS